MPWPLRVADPSGSFYLNAGITCLPNSSMDFITCSWPMVSVAMRNWTWSTPVASCSLTALMQLFRVASHDNTPIGQGIGVHLFPYLLGQGAAAGKVELGGGALLGDLLYVDVAGEVVHQVFGDATPLFQQP